MKTTRINFGWLLTMAFILITLSCIEAQNKKTKVKPAPKSKKTETAAQNLNGMTRDEKNALSKCPLHSKQMSLSDNFLADASSSSTSENYPFAYQLNYRRYCLACTNKMDRTQKGGTTDKQATENHCEIHKEELKPNNTYNKVDFEQNPQPDMPHAKQYLLKKHCKTCTKIYKIQLTN